jgi:Uncharacterized protein conserved in bacteria (DUF2147)
MRLLFAFAALMMIGSPVYAGDSISFVISGHRVHIEAPRHCNSASCVSVSIPGIYEKRGRDRSDDDDRTATGSGAPAAPVQASVIPLATKPTQPVVCAPAPARPIASAAPQVVPPQPQIPSSRLAQQAAMTPPPPPALPPLPPSPSPTPSTSVVRPAEVARPVANTDPRISRVSHEVDEQPDDTPVGDWETEGGKGMVRIEPCGQSLCGYVLDPSSKAKGETVLVDMKSKSASEWSGSIYSRASGNIYYGTIAMKGPNSLRVEACALGRFFCSGNLWSRADIKPQRLISDRGISSEPRS